MSPIFWSSEPITAVPFNLDVSHSSAAWAGTACEVLDAAGAAGAAGAALEVGGACASAVDINALTAARTTSVLLMSYLLAYKPPGDTTPFTCASSCCVRPRFV